MGKTRLEEEFPAGRPYSAEFWKWFDKNSHHSDARLLKGMKSDLDRSRLHRAIRRAFLWRRLVAESLAPPAVPVGVRLSLERVALLEGVVASTDPTTKQHRLAVGRLENAHLLAELMSMGLQT